MEGPWQFCCSWNNPVVCQVTGTRAGLPVSIPGWCRNCPTENPGLLATLKLDDYPGS